MWSKALWIVMTVCYYAAAVVMESDTPSLFRTPPGASWLRSFHWPYALVFAGLGVLLQGTIVRLFSQLTPTLWRPLMLCLGAALALLQLWIVEIATGIPMSVDRWMSAILGLAAIAVLARVLPEAMVLRWYGTER